MADLLDDEPFAEMYAARGREAVWPGLLAMVTIVQFLENVPDRDAADLVVRRLDWKYARHRPLDYAGFDCSCRCYFRKRVLEHQQDALIFETIRNKVKALGFIKKRGKQRTDSLAVIGAVRVLRQLETVRETLRVAVHVLEREARPWAEQNVHFAAATCAACPLRARCTTGESGRSLHIREYHETLEARRAAAQTETFRTKMRARPAIEATLSELVRRHGFRRHRYRGDAKRHVENLLKAAACNLKRLPRALVGRWEQAATVLARVNR
ncbi:MAG: transposase, partial [Chloroflexi bacterium]|nr:transposase [Chloroflexota bacterium]